MLNESFHITIVYVEKDSLSIAASKPYMASHSLFVLPSAGGEREDARTPRAPAMGYRPLPPRFLPERESPGQIVIDVAVDPIVAVLCEVGAKNESKRQVFLGKYLIR